MKQIPKKPLDEIIEVCRQYWETGNRRLVFPMHDKSLTLGNAIGLGDFILSDFISVIVKAYGLCPDAENEKIYSALRALGWDIVE